MSLEGMEDWVLFINLICMEMLLRRFYVCLLSYFLMIWFEGMGMNIIVCEFIRGCVIIDFSLCFEGIF